ncbi:MAG: hypothetical protein HY545_00495 [Candidatus Doudnabacteria bacterium]|nr:hypothetical protein [Candidatus Doudnabacteria bacterium]
MDNLNKVLSSSPPEDLSYLVMPQANRKLDYPAQVSKTSHQSLTNRKWLIYIIAGLVILAAAGGVVYYIWSQKANNDRPAETVSKLPKIWLVKYFNVEACDNQEVCGDDADFDKDGLTNYEEFKAGTDLVKSDTDGDELADGDELNIYKTDPTDKFTDKRTIAQELNYTDGHQIKNGYDPLTPGLKLTETRIQQIADDTAKYGLHAVSD